jgi:hypothetical protein
LGHRAIILFHRAGMLLAGQLRARLAEASPARRWICGEDDDGSPHQTLLLRGHHLICGRGDGAPLFVEMRYVEAPWSVAEGEEPLPPHSGYITLSHPTTEDRVEADLVITLLVESLMSPQTGGAWCQLSAQGGWLAAAGIGAVHNRLRAGEALGRAAAAPRLPEPTGQRPPAPGFHSELPRTDRLPTLLALSTTRPLPPIEDWTTIAQGLDYCDPEGGWRVDPRGDGGAWLSGRGGRITVAPHAQPMPAEWIALAANHSFWLVPGAAETLALRGHGACLAIGCEIDTVLAGPAAARQIAKAMAMTLLLVAQHLARAGVLAGLACPAHATLYPPGHAEVMAQALTDDEVPVQIFVATAFHATTPGAISLSTAGLMPFVGREVEAWNAPGDVETIGARLGNVLRYLLMRGPVLRHGDTLGNSPADRAVRVLMGPSRAERPYAMGQTIPALWLEFGEARPYPMRPGAPGAEAAPPARGVARGARRPGGFGRKGL